LESRALKKLLVTALLAFLPARAAHAEEAPPSPAAARAEETRPEVDLAARDLEQLSSTLNARAEAERRARVWLGLSAVGLGGVTAGAGALVLTRGSRVPGYVVIAEGGGALLVGAYSAFLDKGPLEQLAATRERHRLAGSSDRETLAALHAEWEVLAARSRSRRFASGLTLTILGSFVTTTALLVALRSPSDLELTGQEHALSVAALVGAGVTTASRGVTWLVTPALIEEPLEPQARAASRQSARVSIVSSPLQGGGMAALQVVF